jgi:hypothetical protein
VADERAHVSIVCVFNDPEVRSTCLDRSIAAGLADAPGTEYLPVDNTQGQFSTAGAALNAGAGRARNDVVVLVHQDVYLHSLVALEEAAARLLADPTTGVAGAVGVTTTGTVAGRVRDRVVMIGTAATPPIPVDSLDEVLFMVARDRLLAEPLSEDPDLAWHAYAVEYGARMRAQGLRVVVDHIPLTHNSMTTNLARLAEAHHHVAGLYPQLVPLRTTCGVVRGPQDRGRVRAAWRRRHGLARWWSESLLASRLARAAGVRTRDVVIGDIRLAVDEALDLAGAAGLDVVNLDPAAHAAQDWSVDALDRRGHDVAMAASPAAGLATLPRPDGDRALLLTGVDETTLARLAPQLVRVPHVVGVLRDTGAWVFCHPGAPEVRALWPARRDGALWA